MGMYNHTIKQWLTKAPQAYTSKFVPIEKSQKDAYENVEQRFCELFKVRDTSVTLFNDRTESIGKVLAFLRTSCVFSA